MKALILSILLATACSNESNLTKDAMGLRLEKVEMPISHLNEIEWPVGKKKEAVVSQSFVFTVDMPKVDADDLAHLTELKGINSWILRVILVRGSERQDLGSLFTRFKPKTQVRGQGGGAPSSVAIKIFYAAAYASERFRFFHCPAFSHTNRITDMKIQGKSSPFDLVVGQSSPYPEKAQLVELAPSSFNGGNSLAGEYYIEIAPYDYEKKVIHAAFKRLPMYVEVLSEKKEFVESCAGEHPEIQK